MASAEADPDAERLVIGCALLRDDCARLLVDTLGEEHFTEPARRTLYRALASAIERGELTEHPWEIADRLPEDLLSACGLSRVDVRLMAGQGSSSEPFFRSSLDKLRRLGHARDARSGLQALLAADLVPSDEGSRASIDSLLQRARVAYDALLAPNGADPIRRVAMTIDALDRPLEPPYVIDGWLARGDVALLAGEGHTGKSWVVLDLAIALASATKWLGELEVKTQQRVLVFDEERTSQLTQYRLRRWALGAGFPLARLEQLPLTWLCENGINLDDGRGWRRACSIVDEVRPDWIILDALSRFHGRDENRNSQMAAFFSGRLRGLAARSGAGVIVVHHMGKPAKDAAPDADVKHRIRGASALYDLPDQVLALELDSETQGRVLSHIKNVWGRCGIPCGIEITDVDDGRGTLVRYTGRADDALGALREALREVEWQGLRRAELIVACESAGVRHARRVATRWLGEMHSRGEVKRRREKKEMRYWLAFYAPDDAC